jgi:nitroreductase
MEFSKVLEMRHSSRKFRDVQITKAEIDAILLAGCNAPVGSNLYRDVHITVVQDKTVLEKLNAATFRRMQDPQMRQKLEKIIGEMSERAKESAPAAVPFYGAPTVILVSHRNQDLQPGIEYANVTSIVQIMHLAATNLGLGSVFVWGILESMRMYPDLDRSALLNLPDGFSPLMGLIVGYPVKPLEERELKADKISINFIDENK